MGIKKIICLILIACMTIFALSSLGCKKTSEDVIRESIINRFEPYKTMGEDVVNRLAKTADDAGLSRFGITNEDFAYAILDGFDYSIDEIVMKEKEATAKVTINSKSMSDFSERLKEADADLEVLGNRSFSQDYKASFIHERLIRAINDTQMSSEPITLVFSLNGTEWTSDNATRELNRLDSVIFSG